MVEETFMRRQQRQIEGETNFEKYMRVLIRVDGFDKILASTVAAASTGVGAQKFRSRKILEGRMQRKANVLSYMEQIKKESLKKKVRYQKSIAYERAVEMETRDYMDRKFKRRDFGDFLMRYYYNLPRKYTKEEVKRYKEMLGDKKLL